MAELLKGAPVAAAINERGAEALARLQKAGLVPGLAIVRLGDNPDDAAYENSAVKRCEKAGVAARRVTLPGNCTQAELLRQLEALNSDRGIHGVLLLRPLPGHMDEATVCEAILPEKDVDGMTSASMAGVFSGRELGYPPCTPAACMELLDYYKIDLKGKRAVVVGRSLVVGKPLAMMLLARHATVTICHTRTENMAERCREADILLVAAGRAKMLDGSYLSPGQVVIDVGINVDESGALCGDVDFAAAEGCVSAITPVPGGIGAVTNALLIGHVIEAAEKAALKRG